MDDGVAQLRVVGVSHYQTALERCHPGEAVRFVHEPDNPYDEMALRVVSAAGETIGYLPRKSWVHGAVHQHGRGVSAVIASIGYSRSCMLGALLSIALCDDAPLTASYFPQRAAPEPPRGGFRYWVNTPAAAERLAAARK